MMMHAHVRNGVVVLDEPIEIPEGTLLRIEYEDESTTGDDLQPSPPKRHGGQYAGQIWMAPDFDAWPDDIQEAFGMKP